MDPMNNPFSPGAGTPPPELAGRDPIIETARIALGRIRLGRPAKSLILVGLRGVGKTVLLVRIRDMAESEGYKAILVEAHESKPLPALLIPPLRQILFSLDVPALVSQKVKRGLRVLSGFIKGFKMKIGEVELTIEPELGVADSGDLENDLGALFVAVAEAAADQGTAVALCVDELQYLKEAELSALIMAFHQISQRNLPMILVGAGLPQIVGLAGRSKSYAERLFDFPEVGPLNQDEARKALQAPVQYQNVVFTEAAITETYRVTEGYPYFLQQWGHEAWNLAGTTTIDVPIVEDATQQAIRRLDESFFRVRFDRLTPREKNYLRALADLGPGPQRSGDVAERLGVKVQSVAPLRGGLIRKGMIYSPAHGDMAFTVPLFDQFMKRMIPNFSDAK
jgi:hypothetical protein